MQVSQNLEESIPEHYARENGELRAGSVLQYELRFGLVTKPIFRYRLTQAFISSTRQNLPQGPFSVLHIN